MLLDLIQISRINELCLFRDTTNTFSDDDLKKQIELYLPELENISGCNIFIVTVPTPVNENKSPDLVPLITATKNISKLLKMNELVIYESTVYPGATSNICIPILEENSGLQINRDFYVGYSPERVNPGDNKHTIRDIVKVTSGSNEYAGSLVNNLYKEIIDAGTFLVDSIEIAEAAKVIENTQRDINIALINEFSLIFHKLNIDTEKILKAAETKWNFIPFYPGLVGGHCIGVDPYYLVHRASEIGLHTQIISAGRKLNDEMVIT